MIALGRTLLLGLVVLASGCDGCDDVERSRAPGGGVGAITSGGGGAPGDASADATGAGGAPNDVTVASAASGSANGGGGSANGGGGGGCPTPPDPEACEDVVAPGACALRGCSLEFYDEIHFDDVDGCTRDFDVPGCLPVVTCACEPPAQLLRYRGARVIEWDPGCLEGWEPCVGAAGEPEACRCDARR